MESTESAKSALDKVKIVCPECGKKPANCTVTQLADGIAKEELTCCSGSGYVMVHEQTGYVVGELYKKTSEPQAASPAYIPLPFAGGASVNSAGERVVGWVREKLPMAASCCCAASKASCGFWGKLKQCLSKLWN